jgi:transcriptional regulator with XRE-family HTH domain
MPGTELASSTTTFGSLLLYWRKARTLSQLALANEAEVSARHLCFLETGRAKPSREMVLLLASVLEVPLRERNALLLAAGFAPTYTEMKLDAPELARVRMALFAILRQQEPLPAVVMNRRWDIVHANEGHLMFDPQGLRPYVSNWESVAETLVQRVRREALGGVTDADAAKLLAEVLAYPDVPKRLRHGNSSVPALPVIPICFRKAAHAFDFFSTVTTLGTPQDVALQELRIECFFPANPETEARARALAASGRETVGTA